MSVAEPIIYNYFVVHGLRAWLSINDVPWLPSVMLGSYASNGGINHRLVDGVNKIKFRIEPATDFAREEKLEVTQSDHWFWVKFFRAGPDGEPELITELVLPDDWEKFPEEQRTFPFVGELDLDPGGSVPRATYLDATTVQTPCEGTASLRDAVRRVWEAHQNRDRDQIIELCQPKVQDYALAFPNHADATVQGQLDQLDEMLADKPVFEDLAEDMLHFEARAGGRVVHVTRSDGLAVLSAKGLEIEYRSDILLTQTSNGWRVM